MAPVPMIGRDRELEVLTGIWERVTHEGRAQFVTVFGPAGIGKSRLGLELAKLVADQGARAMRGRSTPYGASTPYSAFAQLVKQYAHPRTDGPDWFRPSSHVVAAIPTPINGDPDFKRISTSHIERANLRFGCTCDGSRT